MNVLLSTLAEASCSTSGGSPFGMPVVLLIVFGLMFFMTSRSQKRRTKERQEMINRVKAGDRVLLTSGILGQVNRVSDNTLIIQIGEKTKVEVVKAAISQVLNEGDIPSEIEPAK
jgi:preprotein translocase subunit YajC